MKDQGNTATLPTPFPYFGGKGLIAPKVWTRFGEVRRYIEPFCGSARVLFARPGDVEGIEIINDANGWLTNFWRAAKLHSRSRLNSGKPARSRPSSKRQSTPIRGGRSCSRSAPPCARPALAGRS